jgi:hypothetical protein
MNVLKAPLVVDRPDEKPTNVFADPFELRPALDPRKVLLLPVDVDAPARSPKNKLPILEEEVFSNTVSADRSDLLRLRLTSSVIVSDVPGVGSIV